MRLVMLRRQWFSPSLWFAPYRAGAKILVLLPQQGDTKNHADNLFALTAQGSNVDLLRVLLLAAEQESSSSVYAHHPVSLRGSLN